MPPKNDDNLIDKEDPDLDEAIEGAEIREEDEDELDLELLTQEERDTLAEDDGSEPDVLDPDADELEPVVVDAAKQAAAQQPAPVVDPAANPDTPGPIIPAPVDRTAELADLTAKETKLQSDFADGQINDADYTAQLKAIAKEQGKYEAEAETHANAVKEARAAGDAAFLAAANAVKAKNPELFMPDHITAFNRHVEAVTADPRNSKLTFSQQLEKAQLLYSVDIDRPDLAPIKQNPAPKPAAAKTAKVEPIRAQPVPTLARIPAAAANETEGDRFAAIDALPIEKRERAIQRMTPDQREAYEAFSG